MKEPFFSIIVPVYNVKDYIKDSINSILNQSFTNFELLLINDGSTDGSQDILNSVANRDNRAKVLTQSNKGVSEARNLGLENANGRWIIFVDADDGLKRNALELLYDYIKQYETVDLIGYGFEKVNDLNKTEEYVPPANFKIFSNQESVSFNTLNHYMVWTLAIKKAIIGNLRFKQLKNGEDVLFCNSIALKSNSYLEIEGFLYLYLQRKTSARSNKWELRRYEDYANLHNEILLNLETTTKLISKGWQKRWLGNLLIYNNKVWELDRSDQKKFFGLHRDLLKRANKLKNIPGLFKFWIYSATFINNRNWFKLIAMKPMKTYAQYKNH